MSSARRRAFGAAEATEWPAELYDPGASAWASRAALAAWRATHRLVEREGPHAAQTPAQRRLQALKEWARANHPDERWPSRADQHWMNSSGLRAVEQAAQRIAWEEQLSR